MFSYKGVDKNYKYKVGRVDSEDEIEAVRLIKEQEEILIIVSIERVSNSKFAGNFSYKVREKFVEVENKFKSFQSKTNKSKKKKSLKSSSEESIADKSPILKAIKNFTSKPDKSGKSLADKSPILKAIQKVLPTSSKAEAEQQRKQFEEEVKRIFKENNLIGKESILNDDYDDNLSKENKVSYSKPESKIEKIEKGGKSINWDLLDTHNSKDPEIMKNNKLKVKSKEVLMFTRRFQIMISSGMSLLSSLKTLQETSSKNMAIVLSGILEEINAGNSFSQSIAKYPKVFDATYVSLISIGEISGELDNCLLDIIKMKEQESKVLKKVKTASIYPAIIGLVLVVMMIGASFMFIPRFEEMFLDQGLTIPKFTEIVFGIASKVPYIVGIIAILAVVIAIAKKKSSRVNQVYSGIVDKLILKTPIVKNISTSLYMYYFSSTVSMMLKNGIRLSDTLALASKSINNIYIRNEIANVGQLMIHGFSFSEALRKQEHFDEILVNITHTGEESGQMVFSLAKVSEFYETELNTKVDALMEIVPSASIILIGVIAAPVIIAVYLPILDISSGAGLAL